jgi:hypothetical protein
MRKTINRIKVIDFIVYISFSLASSDVRRLMDMLTRLRKDKLKEMERLRKEKNLKKIKIKKDLPLGVKVGLMKMGFDVEYEEN